MENALSLLERMLSQHAGELRVEELLPGAPQHETPPQRALLLGSTQPHAPSCVVVGGIHGNERIGVDVVVAFLQTLLARLEWDDYLRAMLEAIRLIIVPIANPSGYVAGTRATAAGIDLMRNAPIDAPQAHWLAGGQRLSRHLPWYRGRAMAPENAALAELIERWTADSPITLSVDCHSGFGAVNRIWFPWAHRPDPMPHLAEIYALRTLFRQTYPHHIAYRIEPQCQHYMIHGDLWDYLYARSLARGRGPLLPLTLEMGSWLWVRKNPWQIFSRHGLFNPQVPHRRRRILRQHLVFLNFLLAATANAPAWLPRRRERDALHADACNYWRAHFEGGDEAADASRRASRVAGSAASAAEAPRALPPKDERAA